MVLRLLHQWTSSHQRWGLHHVDFNASQDSVGSYILSLILREDEQADV